MKEVKTKITEVALSKIQATGKTVYQFLQEAVQLKLESAEQKDISSLIEQQHKEFERRMDEKNLKSQNHYEEIIIKGIQSSHKLHEDSLKKDAENREKILGVLNQINSKLKG